MINSFVIWWLEGFLRSNGQIGYKTIKEGQMIKLYVHQQLAHINVLPYQITASLTNNSTKPRYELLATTHITRPCGSTSKHYLRLGNFDDFKFGNWVFKKERSIMPRRKQRSSFDQVSEFDRGRIVAYRDCRLSFREIGSRVGRNQTTILRICDP
ncbi:hypothetical protein LAZ67_1006974 [Cordylochernes scorpioides]|uniref:Uncharacterized protein n=1 Tax=Cordylochernes scorpioides TaxID=51811 RepID=A0ABY6K2K4_9ARAC|nr:hypothetical protein LAZ67_1006974 [Cordylochernes scorpioides]